LQELAGLSAGRTVREIAAEFAAVCAATFLLWGLGIAFALLEPVT
jgi:hypothetical protein